MSSLEIRIRALTAPKNGQYPRPWMSCSVPGSSRVFVVGFNQATPLSVTISHDAYIDALFNRNGCSIRELFNEARGGRGPSLSRRNIGDLSSRLAKRGVMDVLDQCGLLCCTYEARPVGPGAQRWDAYRQADLCSVDG